jgi:hypothetical protein
MRCARVQGRHVAAHLLHGAFGRGVDFVDDHHVGQTHVRLAGVVARLVASPVRIHQNDMRVRHEEGRVVVAAVPDEHVGLGLHHLQDLRVVHAHENDAPRGELRLVLLALNRS